MKALLLLEDLVDRIKLKQGQEQSETQFFR